MNEESEAIEGKQQLQKQPMNKDEIRATFASMIVVTDVETTAPTKTASATTTSNGQQLETVTKLSLLSTSNSIPVANDNTEIEETKTIDTNTNNDNNNSNNINHQSLIQLYPDINSLPKFISKSYKIDTIPTHIWIQYFVDRIVVGISQLEDGRIGNWILCENEFISSSENPLFNIIDQSMLSSSSSISTATATATLDKIKQQQQQRHEITHLLGSSRNDPVVSLYARRIWENFSTIPSTANRPVLLGITLKSSSSSLSNQNHTTTTSSPQSITTFNTIIGLVTNLHVQGGIKSSN